MNPVGKALWLIENHFARNISLDDTAHARDYGGRSEISSHGGARLEAQRTVAEPTTSTHWFLLCGGPHLGYVAGEGADRRPAAAHCLRIDEFASYGVAWGLLALQQQ